MPTSLTNFNVPVLLRQRFDAICHASGRTRTSVLVELMSGYILTQSQLLATRIHQMRLVDEQLEENSVLNGERSLPRDHTQSYRTPPLTGSDREFDLPEFLVSDGQEDW